MSAASPSRSSREARSRASSASISARGRRRRRRPIASLAAFAGCTRREVAPRAAPGVERRRRRRRAPPPYAGSPTQRMPDARRDARGSGACGPVSSAQLQRASRCRSARRRRRACAQACRSATTAIVVRADRDGGRSARRRSSRARRRRARRARYSRLTVRAASWRTRSVCAVERLRDDDQAARVLVETMHDAGARQRARACGCVVQQRVQQRAVAIAAARMDDEARRLST